MREQGQGRVIGESPRKRETMPHRILLIIFVLLIPWIPTLWAILDVPRRRFPSTRGKVIWFAVVSLLPVLGAILYISLVRRNTQPL